MLYVGIDGGGTQSRLIAVDEKNHYYGPFYGGSTNLNSNRYDDVKIVILELLKALEVAVGEALNIQSLCIGSAGIDTAEDIIRMKQMFQTLLPSTNIIVVNDVEIVLEANSENAEGVVLISGTGSIGYGKNTQGETFRSGGFGHLLGDEGSGYWIGKEILRHVYRSEDGRGPETRLLDLVKDFYQVETLDDLLKKVYDYADDKTFIAGCSLLLQKAIDEEDQVALQIMNEVIEELYLLVKAVQKKLQLGDNYPIILSGGTILKNQSIYEGLKSRLKELTTIVVAVKEEPYVGALKMALKN